MYKTTYIYEMKGLDGNLIELHTKVSIEEDPIEIVKSYVLNRRTSDKIHLADDESRLYRFMDTTMTLRGLRKLVDMEEKKYEFIDSTEKIISNLNPNEMLPGMVESKIRIELPNDISNLYNHLPKSTLDKMVLTETITIEKI